MKRSLALTLGALVLLAGLWALRTFLDASPHASSAAGAPRPARAVGPAPRKAEAGPDRERDDTRAEPATVAGAREAVAEAATSAAFSPLRVDVSDGLTREPVAGARLRFAAVERDLVLEEHPGWMLETCDAWLAEHGGEALSGSDGSAELRAPVDGLLIVTAWAPQRFGRAIFDLRDGSQRALVLRPDTTLEVLTVEAGGAALAGAEVALVRTGKSWGTQVQHQRTSDAGGRIVYAHVGLLLDLAREPWALVAPSLLGQAERVPLDPLALPTEPVRIVFPATGSVLVRVTPAPGLPEFVDGEVTLLVDEGRPDELLSFWTRPESVARPIVEGVARFENVPLGLDLIAESAPAGHRVATRVHGRGPDAAGGTTTLTLVIGGDHPVVRLRLLDGEGAPLARRTVSAQLQEDEHSLEFQLESDDQGRVLVDLRATADPIAERTLALSLPALDGAPGGRAMLRLPDGLAAGLNDLGDLAFDAERPLVAGRVVGADGEPVAGIEIHVVSLQSYDGERTWIEELPVAGNSGVDGTFVVHGADPGTLLRVTAQIEGQRSAPVDCAAGSLDLVLELVRTGWIAGRVRLDDGVDPGLLSVRVRAAVEGQVDDYRQNWRTQVHADGSFRLSDLSAGAWSLEFGDSAGRVPVALIEGIDVPPGEASGDPRLAEVDLRGRMALVRVTLQPPRASDVVLGSLVYRPAGSPPGGEDQSTAYLHERNVTLCVAGRAADLTVLANGFRPVELSGVRGEVTVELVRGPAVRLRLSQGAVLPRPPRFLKPYLTATEEDFQMGGHFQQTVFDERREVLLHAPGPGRLRVEWFLEERSENSLSTTALSVPEPQWLDVLDLAGEQVFEVFVPDFEH
jgi:hypothetical protein